MIKFGLGLAFVLIAFLIRKRKHFKYSSYSNSTRLKGLEINYLYYIPHLLILIVVGLLLFSITQPSIGYIVHKKKLQGLGIVLALDMSSSMNNPTKSGISRLKAAREASEKFVKSREGTQDKLGIVAYSSKAYVLCPLTSEKKLIKKFLADQKKNPLHSMTAIGRALKTSLATVTDLTLEDIEKNLKISDVSKKKGKIVILFTDGNHNTGISPKKVLPLAKKLGVKIYLVSTGSSPSKEVKHLISETGGTVVSAKDMEEVEEVFLEISKNEKAIMVEKEQKKHREVTTFFTGFALLIFSLAVCIREVVFPTL